MSVALLRPTGVPQRRCGEDPWQRARFERPRRLTDELAWLRDALEDPESNASGRSPTTASSWAVLEAAGFLLYEHEASGG